MKNRIAIQKILNEDIKTAVFSALDLINAEELMKEEGMTILLKPNVLMSKPPERAATTHPEIVRAVIQWVKQFNPKQIYVCDSAGTQRVGATDQALIGSGIKAVCDEEGAECIPFEKTERKIYEVNDPLEIKEITSSKLIEEADLIINIPKIKTHGQCMLTCCIKNMFGTVLLGNKAKVHAQAAILNHFTAALTDIYSVSNPQLTIIDGYLCQEGQGPSKGDVVKMDLILAGYDGVALDTVVCRIIDFDPKDVLYLAKAEQKNLGTMNLEEIEILGENIEDVFRKFKPPRIHLVSAPLPRWLADYMGKTIFKATVKFKSDKCKLCSTCWDNCPVQAISPPKELKKGNIPIWDKKKCITCYCCAELCPHEAVDFKMSFVKNALTSWIGIGLISVIIIIILLLIILI